MSDNVERLNSSLQDLSSAIARTQLPIVSQTEQVHDDGSVTVSTTFAAASEVPARDSRVPDTDPMTDPLVDPPSCINCGLPRPDGARWRLLSVCVEEPDGDFSRLEEWPLCPDCETSQGATLVEYVKYRLS